MNDKTLGMLIAGGLFVIAGVFITIYTIYEHKKLIRQNLENKGAKNIAISWDPFDFDRSNYTYRVTYLDIDGNIKIRVCKIHMAEETIYWKDEANP